MGTGTRSCSPVHFVFDLAQHFSKTDYRWKSAIGTRTFSMSMTQYEYCTRLNYVDMGMQRCKCTCN
jgi:hypothetical protein